MRILRDPRPKPWSYAILGRADSAYEALTAPGLAATADFIARSFPEKRRRRLAELPGLEAATRERLADPRAVVVLGGQQPGLFGGPLLASLKLHAVFAVAREVERRLRRPVVPLYWHHSEDHDLLEANRCYVPSGSEIRKLALAGLGPARALDSVELSLHHQECLQGWAKALWREDPPLREEAMTLADHARRHLEALQPPSARVAIVEPASVWRLVPQEAVSLLENHTTVRALLSGEERRLAARGHAPQVDLGEASLTLLYIRDERGGRHRLRFSGGHFHGAPSGELRAADLAHQPWSASALARPILTQAALPVLTHVLGPAEAAYFQQVGAVFDLLSLPRPRVLPRPRALVLSRFAREGLTCLELSHQDLLSDPESWAPQGTTRELAFRLRAVSTAWAEVESVLDLCEESAPRPELRRDLRRRLNGLLASCERAYRDRALRRDGFSVSERRRFQQWLRPRGLPQERLLNPGILFTRREEAAQKLAALDPFAEGWHLLESEA